VTRIAGLTGATLPTAPTVCHDCVWWQSRSGRSVDKRRWIRGTEEEWGAWGTVYYDDDGRLLGSMQYGPSDLFPRAAELPAGPPSDDAVLVTCAYMTGRASPWVMQSLFLVQRGEVVNPAAETMPDRSIEERQRRGPRLLRCGGDTANHGGPHPALTSSRQIATRA